MYPNENPTVEELFRRHSKARVLVPSQKRFLAYGEISRPLTDADVLKAHTQKYVHNR